MWDFGAFLLYLAGGIWYEKVGLRILPDLVVLLKSVYLFGKLYYKRISEWILSFPPLTFKPSVNNNGS